MLVNSRWFRKICTLCSIDIRSREIRNKSYNEMQNTDFPKVPYEPPSISRFIRDICSLQHAILFRNFIDRKILYLNSKLSYYPRQR